ncbi:hypothetical protein D918_02547 [Trichuris suis]|nr:hypothetical protein D918_02547 [Trichuris suis]
MVLTSNERIAHTDDMNMYSTRVSLKTAPPVELWIKISFFCPAEDIAADILLTLRTHFLSALKICLTGTTCRTDGSVLSWACQKTEAEKISRSTQQVQ